MTTKVPIKIEVKCPECKNPMSFSEDMLGFHVECATCGTLLIPQKTNKDEWVLEIAECDK